MTISTAIRNLPEPPTDEAPPPARARARRRSRSGSLLIVLGLTSGTATPLMLGVSLVLMSLVPLLRLAGVPERVAFTGCGLAIVVFLLLPWRVIEARVRHARDGLLHLDRRRAADRRRRPSG